jgi:hypothetical protein
MEAILERPTLPPLTQALLDCIMFAMEDQANTYYIDLKEGELLNEDEMNYIIDEQGLDAKVFDERFLPIPDWEPSDGFQLMEQFSLQVRNPLYRERLLSALQSGRGVFRKFKDALAEIPILERKWYAFKDEHLKRAVVSWYRDQEGSFNLLALNDEDSEVLLDDILLEDFTFETYEGSPSEQVLALVQELFEEMENGSEEQQISALLLTRHFENEDIKHFQLAKAQDGTLAAFLSYIPLSDSLVEVPLFGVKKEFRGLGLFRMIFDSFARQMARFHYRKIVVTLAGDAVGLERIFSPYGVYCATKQLLLTSESWNLEHPSSEQAFV